MMSGMIEIGPAFAIAAIVALGAAAQWVAWRVSIPAILPLLVIGFVVGPILGWVDPDALIGPDLLFPSISLAVGLILFEGGLTLRIPEVKETRRVVLNLVTVGALISWLGGSAAAHWIAGLSWPVSALFGALVIVTGPTVIGPLLRIVRPNARVSNVLKWEGILIDAVGAMVAVLVFEFLVIENRSQALGHTVLLMIEFVVAGAVVGIASGWILTLLLRRRKLPDYLVNVVALAMVFATFAIANAVAPESGLLATILMGAILANSGLPNIDDLLSFKEDLTVLFISVLFIVLAANIELAAFMAVLDLSSLLLLAVILLVLRPLSVFASSIRSSLSLKEKLFLSWIAPRGIVAAAVSSLFAGKLIATGFEGAETFAPLVFLVIVGTVLLSSLTGRPVANALGVAEPDPQGLLLLGAHPFARRIGEFLQDEGVRVLLADTNWSNVAAARVEGLPAYYGSLLSDHSDDELNLAGIGRLLALTSNDEANALTSLKYAREFGSQDVYQLEPSKASRERDRLGGDQRGRLAFQRAATYRELEHLFARGAKLKKTRITEQFSFEDFAARYAEGHLPMFVLQGKKVRVLTPESPPPEPGTTLVSVVIEEVGTGERAAEDRAVPQGAPSGR